MPSKVTSYVGFFAQDANGNWSNATFAIPGETRNWFEAIRAIKEKCSKWADEQLAKERESMEFLMKDGSDIEKEYARSRLATLNET